MHYFRTLLATSFLLPVLPAQPTFDTNLENFPTVSDGHKDAPLRIMPLGASITQGMQSTDGNGYRNWLRLFMVSKGREVDMVGSKKDGNMTDNDNEGHPGFTISEVYGAWNKSAGLRPNLVLVNAGTNDCIQSKDTKHAGVRMKALIDDIFKKVPETTVILSTLVPSRDNGACARNISTQFRELVKSKHYRNARLGLADIESSLKLSDLADGTHPNDGGYKIFAGVWCTAIDKLQDKI
ncbi:hypothetical protein HYFRA_00005919 [Hymenoscyphus fraxineus]|uniref:SGNH hydrolase-type esterase domain-containing protein n=1 Tax=Hymenoscyphus fraxineus TaxID=746836 RepID=A0A9N9KXA4_9HELO|nr:hypothetical protein HYFRA_00005919 [Hymenoscyphus fraxineus]